VGLLDFVGVTGSGFVQTWYDQSGNSYDLTQGTTTAQPLIIGSGSVFTDTNRPAVYFDGGDSLLSPSTTQTMDYLSAYILARPLIDPAFGYGWWRIGTTDQGGYKVFLGYNNDINRLYYNKSGGSSVTLNAIQAGKKQLLTIDVDTAGFTIYDNNTLSQTVSRAGILAGGTQIKLGTSIYGTSPVTHQENIIYPESRKTTTLLDVNSSILSAYTTGSDPDYQAFITATGITEPTQSAALETLVSDLKSYGLWSKMKAIYPMVTDRNNRFAQSEDFSLTWNAQSASVSPTQIVAPDGTTTGDLIREEAGTGDHYVYQTVDTLVSGSEYILSVYGRFLNRPWIALQTNDGAQAWFNLQTGVTGSFTGSRATITPVSGGWYRCALFYTASSAGAKNQHIHLSDADGNFNYTGVATTGSYLWGAQFENGNVLGPYKATTTTGFTTGSMLDQMKFNLRNPADTDAAYRIQYSGSWNGGYSGVKPDGTTAYGNAFIKNNAMGSSSIHLSTYSRTNPAGSDGVVIGNSTSYYNLLRLKNSSNNFRGGINANTLNTVSNSNSTGYYIGLRTSTTTNKFFKNNTLLGTLTDNVLVDSNDPIYLGAAHRTGNPIFYDNKEIAIATIGDGLTDYEAKALYWIVQKFQTTLGRQVY
jgi:hypothetical protein